MNCLLKTILTLLLSYILGLILHAQGPIALHNDTLQKDQLHDYNYHVDSTRLLAAAHTYIKAHLSQWDLSPQDIEDMSVNDMYTDNSSGISRIYFQQRYRGIPVYNAILNVCIGADGKVFFAGSRFVQNLARKVNVTSPALHAQDAVMLLSEHLGLAPGDLHIKRQEGETLFVFDGQGLSQEPINAKLCYQPIDDRVSLSWDILLAPAGSSDKWSSRVDAKTGEILHEFNWTLYCMGKEHAPGGEVSVLENANEHVVAGAISATAGGEYNVWPAPTESPNHGPRTMVSNPADPMASPFGWHDINGVQGAEYTITRGNNAFVYQDRNNTGYSSNDEPNGGAELRFDFPFNASMEPKDYIDASVVNFFYWCNYLHDFSYRFGFNEAAGNFQVNNYERGGLGNDPIYGVAQVGANVGIFSNPFYRHGNEGTRGVIFMEEFIRGSRFLNVNTPNTIAGVYPSAIPVGDWGAGTHITTTPVTGQVVLMQDKIEEPYFSDGCDEIMNASSIQGKIVMVDRGGCDLISKILNAQAAAAIGVIICNHNDEFISELYPDERGSEVHIPVIMVTKTVGQLLRVHLDTGVTISLVDPGNSAPTSYDVGLDNGFIAHEYAHGITWRLSGGPSAACVDNDEQMDEGWSDFFALVTTVRPGDTGEQPRGIGSYLLDEPTSGLGSRRYPYSTNMNISPLTYGDVAESHERHDVGEVWANVVWDMYWAFVEVHGWSADPYNPSSGNYKAIRLAFDALKNLPCTPGFVDGRDAILAADQSLFGGDHQCLLWEVFARRGLGYSADQGSPWTAGDQKEAFDLPPACANELRIAKSVSPLIDAGEEIEVSIRVDNFKSQKVTGVNVTDVIPGGTTYIPFSSNVPASVEGNKITFNLSVLAPGEQKIITYRLNTDPHVWSRRIFLDNVNPDNDWWIVESTCEQNWSLTDNAPVHSGNYAWYAEEIPGACNQALVLNPEINPLHVDGNFPVLRFYHSYNTVASINGGIVEVREIGTTSWKPVDHLILRNDYPQPISFYTFSRLGLSAFSGADGNEFKATCVDLGPWKGKDIQIRFRFGTNHISPDGTGWIVDDIEYMDMISYNGTACVLSDQGDYSCSIAPEGGTIVDSKAEVSSGTRDLPELAARIYPNPAKDKIAVELPAGPAQDVEIRLMSADGRLVYTNSVKQSQGDTVLDVTTRDIPSGMYLLQVNTHAGRHVERVVIHH